jgi:hypothetical protein
MSKKEKALAPYEGDIDLIDLRVKKGDLISADKFLRISERANKLAQNEVKTLRAVSQMHRRNYREIVHNSDASHLYNEAYECAKTAGDLFKKEEKYGAAEKAYSRAKQILESSDLELERSPSGYEPIERERSRTHDNRLLKIDKYLGRKGIKDGKNLEGVAATTSIIGFLGSLFFLSPNLTGNIVGLNQTTSNFTGSILFIVGLIGVFAYFRVK